MHREAFASGVSNVSDSDRGHLRGISETSVSTDGATGVQELGDGERGLAGLVSPVSPPIGSEGADFIGAGGSVPRRKSNFQEEGLGGEKGEGGK